MCLELSFFIYFRSSDLKSIRYISKVIALLLLLVMGQSFYCSAMCAFGADSCCRQVENTNADECCKAKACCDEESLPDQQDGGCQKDHMAFFQNIGKFCSHPFISEIQVFQFVTALVVPILDIKLQETPVSLFANTGFHPPPPNDEVRILIQSFQI
ncbi:hypothetical protein BH11BAC1_BH11BAC1_21580 [soil metagenome]